MAVDWSGFVTLVRQHQRFLLTTHMRPDGDGLGSQLALADILTRMGKEVRLVIASTWPPRYDFMDPDKRIERFRLPGTEWQNTQAIVVLDTGTWNQLGEFGDFMKGHPAAKAVIDHHISQDDLGAQRFIDTSAEATGRLVYEAITALEQPLTPRAASNLFVALAMDTGWFRFSNTTAATYALAEQLVRAGAQPAPVNEKLFDQNTLPRMKLVGLVLQRLQVVENGRVAYTELLNGDYQATGAVPQDSEDLVNYTRAIVGVLVGLFFMEQPAGGVKVSFRAREGVDVAKVAEQFGGGGHRLASGAIVHAPLAEVRARVLDAIRQALPA